MKIDLAVFDLAGTTVKDNQDVHRVLQSAMAKFDVEISLAEANAVMGIPKPVAIRKLLENKYDKNGTIPEELVDEMHAAFVDEMILFYKTDSKVGEKDGVTDTFKKLKSNGIKVIVDTGFNRSITDAVLARMKWIEHNLIDGSVTSDEVQRGRPYPDMVYKAMEIARVWDNARVAKVGDTASDLGEGKAAGCGFVIGITSGAFSEEELMKIEHTHLIKEVPEVLTIFQID